MPKFRRGQTVFFINTGKWITPAHVLRVAGKDVVLVYEQYGNNAAMCVSENRVYATMKEAKAALAAKNEMQEKLKIRY